MKRKEVTIEEYNEIMEAIINKKQNINDTFIEMIETAGNCVIVDKKRKKKQ